MPFDMGQLYCPWCKQPLSLLKPWCCNCQMPIDQLTHHWNQHCFDFFISMATIIGVVVLHISIQIWTILIQNLVISSNFMIVWDSFRKFHLWKTVQFFFYSFGLFRQIIGLIETISLKVVEFTQRWLRGWFTYSPKSQHEGKV